MKRLDFYDLVAKEKFYSSNYKKISRIVNGKKRYFAIAISPSGKKSSRVISKEDYKSN